MVRFPTLAFVLALVLLPEVLAAQARPSQRIGIIDSRVLMQEMPDRSLIDSQFNQETAKARQMVHSAADALKAAVEGLSRTEGDLRPQQREAAVMVIRARELALEDMVSQLNLHAQKRLDELHAPLRQRLREAVKAVRVREKLSMIIDVADGSSIIDADDSLNIMPLVRAELLRKTPPGSEGRR